MAPAGDRFDSDCVVGTQFESSQPHHAVLHKRRFPGFSANRPELAVVPHPKVCPCDILITCTHHLLTMAAMHWGRGSNDYRVSPLNTLSEISSMKGNRIFFGDL